MALNLKEELFEYVHQFNSKTPIIQKELIEQKKNIHPVTVRQNLLRLANEEKIIKSPYFRGVYYLPEGDHSVSHTLDYLFIKRDDGVFGYETGINFINQLGLTAQTSPYTLIKSNKVSEHSKTLTIGKRKIMLGKPRVQIDRSNYKLLQVLDTLPALMSLSELNYDETAKRLSHYLNQDPKPQNHTKIIQQYPLKHQLIYFEMGLNNVFTSSPR